jgi:hypothetical protein
MKTLKILLLLGGVILSGFSIGPQTYGTKEDVVVPMKFWLSIFPVHSTGDIACIPEEAGITLAKYGYLKGHQTHGGQFIPELSTWEITNCSLSPGLSVSQVNGTITVANGDSYTWNCIMTISVTGSVALDATITGGTGRFDGATGEIVLTGVFDEVEIPCSGEGYIHFLK